MGLSAIGASPPHLSFRPPMAKPVVLPAVSNCLICGIGDEPATMSQFEEVSPRGAASRAPRAFRLAWLAACLYTRRLSPPLVTERKKAQCVYQTRAARTKTASNHRPHT